MPIVYSKAGVVIRCGDALAELRDMADQSVNCCVSSPPYWGLRDYGTATWEGGDAACDHKAPVSFAKSTLKNDGRPVDKTGWSPSQHSGNSANYRDRCGKCGAVRVDQQLGLEATPQEYVAKLVEVFREVRRVLRDDGTVWCNLGDSYATGAGKCNNPGSDRRVGKLGYLPFNITPLNRMPIKGIRTKNLIGVPWRVAFALQDDGWILRNEIIWHKPSVLPESVKDRCTRDHEHVFLFAKSPRYYFDQEAVKVPASPDSHARYARGRSDSNQTIAKSMKHMLKPGVNPKAAENATGSRQNASFSAVVKDVVETRNLRTVWSIPTAQFSGSHFATFPPDLITPCILAGCPEGGIVLDPFGGSGTVCQVAKELGRKSVAIELNPEYIPLIRKRVEQHVLFGAD